MIGDVGMHLHGLVKDDLPLGERTADAIGNGVDPSLIDIDHLPEVMLFGRVIKIFVKLEIIERMEAGDVALRLDAD